MRFFRDSKPLQAMLEDVCPQGTKRMGWWATMRRCASVKHGMFRAKLDAALVDLIWRAAKISTAAGRKKARIGDFMSALALDDELVRRLYEQRGLLLNGHLGPLP